MNPIFVASVACCRSRMDRMAQPTKMMNSLPHDDGNRETGGKPGTVTHSRDTPGESGYVSSLR